jgi:hypothetical protein
MKGAYQIEFSASDCIRSGIVRRVLERYELEEEIILGESNPFELNLDAPSEGELVEGVHIVEN